VKPLIDADLLVYECGFGAQWQDDQGLLVINNFEHARELLEAKVESICSQVFATEEPTLYLSGGENFREKIAVTRPYKGNRGAKPYHYDNLRAFILSKYDTVLTDGIEADDQLAMDHLKEGETILCSRDKDLRQVPGPWYSWEVWNAPASKGNATEVGFVETNDKKELKGHGIKFFYGQCITGDTVDNIPGLEGRGPVYAVELLSELETEDQMYQAVLGAYEKKYGENGAERLLEQAQLLWMIREVDDEGRPIMWKPPHSGGYSGDAGDLEQPTSSD